MTIRLVITVLIIAALVLVTWHDIHNFKVYNYEVKTDKIKGDMTFVLLADLHGYTYGPRNERLIKAIDDIKPDAILCAGDMMNATKEKGVVHIEEGEHVLKELASRYPVFCGNGNHEKKLKKYNREFGNLYERYREGLKRAGVVYLENESALFPGKNIRVSGLELELEYFRKFVKRQMEPELLNDKLGETKDKDRDVFQILIAHNPQYFKEYANWGADLTVSGHVHGGIIRLPFLGGVISPAMALFPKYDGGKYQHDGKTMILSRGLGTHTINVRMFNPAEISVIKIKGV
ncbi:MAG: metallophosphoesterase [Butyrivibrio sp.]|nr:metallophosphoesterase [Butyrivibrio sp.]